MSVVGFDTSNYTTSVAVFDGLRGENCSQLLPVKPGELGLRQSDAVFHHTKSLPALCGRLFSHIDPASVTAVGVSTRPREVAGSYMPCFLVGYSHACLLADALHVPLVTCSHQQGHIAAALFSAGRLELLSAPLLCWHLSGGTTELLLAEPAGSSVCCTAIGGTTDISAGQLIDRTGQVLGLPFPSGRALDTLCAESSAREHFRVRCKNAYFSLSGMENQMRAYALDHAPCDTAAFVLGGVADAVLHATENALRAHPGLPVVFSGGVASNSLLRRVLAPLSPVFGEPQYSTDNAMGVAVLTYRSQEEANGTAGAVSQPDQCVYPHQA